MGVPVISTAFVGGELSPSLFGRTDLDRYRVSASTFRNGFVNYRGGFNSRAGTAFCGYSKQTGRAYPPRLVPFQFSVNQGLALEFGNNYMRVLSDGAFVTDLSLPITGATQADPCVLTFGGIGDLTVTSAVASNAAVSASYSTGDTVTLAGGTYSTQAVLLLQSTALASLAVNAPGSGYNPLDTITLSGGAVVQVQTVQAISVTTTASYGGGGTPGVTVFTLDQGTGTQATFQGTINGSGELSPSHPITVLTGGSYTAVPKSGLFAVTGGSISGCVVYVELGAETVSVINGGSFSSNPSTFAQGSTSGSGYGATFNTPLYGPGSLSVQNPGVYSALPINPVAQDSTSGTGAGATFTINGGAPPPPTFQTGDWVQISGVGGMTQLNGLTAVLTEVTIATYSLQDVFGNNIDARAFGAYTSGGVVQRIYTLPTVYGEEDLRWLKFVQSADVMSICCVNQQTETEYEPQDLARISDTNWTFTAVVAVPTVDPPTGLDVSGTDQPESPTAYASYAYEVTSVSPVDGSESIASAPGTLTNAIDIAETQGNITIGWVPVSGVSEYNIYKATPGSSSTSGNAPVPPSGSLFGYAGSAYGASFIDDNIVADFSQVPPTHQNPFARGQILNVNILQGGSSYTSITYSIQTNTGTGLVLTPILQSGALVGFIIVDPGQNYQDGDTITITGVAGSGATASLVVGPESGTYPSVPSYFQQRRAYANSLNNTDTYWMSQPGSYTNFDTRVPTIASDAITGSPWSFQVNGIQAMVPTSGGLLIFTGLSAWLLVGPGSFATNVEPISPAAQDAVVQATFGCSPIVPPVKIGYDVVYVNQKGSFYYDQPYQLYALSEPIDLTESSTHLFVGYSILEHAWCEQPYKLVWAVRSDGAMLSLTFYKAQQVAGWARHDTNGLFQSVCSITELPVDALYVATQRFINGQSPYMIERMDDRIWNAAEDVWAVDCGLALGQPTPAATLSASSPTGLGAVTGGTIDVAGLGYSQYTVGTVVDAPINAGAKPGPGTGAVPTLTFNAQGELTAISFSAGNQGSGYLNPQLNLIDPATSPDQITPAQVTLTLSNAATFTASASVFSAGNVGSVIRMGGGIALITAYTDTQHVTANILSPIVGVINSPSGQSAIPQPAGNWTMTAPVTQISGLYHLVGMTVTGLADGNVIPPQTVSATGSIVLPEAASAVTVGLGFTAQLQDVRIDTGSPTVQGQRKKIAAVTVRMESSRGITVGTNQIDGSTLSPPSLAPSWEDLVAVPDYGVQPYNAIAQPLFTGDARTTTEGGFATPGQVAVQQTNPLPMNILALIPELLPGDDVDLKAPRPAQRASA